MERFASWADRQLERLTGLFAIVGALGVTGLMAIILIAVIWRYGINNPIFGIGDMSTLVLSIVAAASVIYGARNNAHISIDLISRFFGRRITRYTDLVMRLLTLAILCLATYALITKACGFEKGCLTENLSIAHRPFYYLLAVSMGLYALHILVQLLQGLVHFKGDDPNDPGGD